MRSYNTPEARVLIVDDSFLMRSTIRKVVSLESRITEVDEAQNGQEALDLVKENDYDIILLDIEMPVMDGIEFMKRCKIHTDARVIIISSLARVNSPQVEKAIYFGAYDVVAKPTGILSLGLEESKSNEILEIIDRTLSLSANRFAAEAV